jgi:hypothetical protein
MAETPRDKATIATAPGAELPVAASELPVVARLIVEVRSDGSRTVARGAMEDAHTGMKAAIEASGSTPLELALALAKSMFAAPWLKRQVALSSIRALLKK